MIGEVLLHRLTSQFRRVFKRKSWSVRGFYFYAVNLHHLPFQIVYHSTSTFITYFVNQGVAHELIAPQIFTPFPEWPTDNSIEIAVGFTPDVGSGRAQRRPMSR
jgi:pre-mRNA-splicing factor CWC22